MGSVPSLERLRLVGLLSHEDLESVVVQLLPALGQRRLQQLSHLLDISLESLYAAVDVALLGGGFGPHHVLGALGLVVVEEVPNHFVGSERRHESALVILNFPFLNNIDGLLDGGSLVRHDFGLLLRLVHPRAVPLSLQILVNQLLNGVFRHLRILKRLQNNTVLDVLQNCDINTGDAVGAGHPHSVNFFFFLVVVLPDPGALQINR